ncbi:MAG: tetratricopeptide repeat protein [Planctomycetota bacterium]
MDAGSDRVREVFDQVAEAPNSERPALLDRLCGGDDALRGEVLDLLQALDSADLAKEFVDGISWRQTAKRNASAPEIKEGAGTRIGPYTLIKQLGEGGFGVVFLAQQEQPVRRQVALKIIKLGMDTRQVIARFEVERQALAVMDHSNIAKVYDAGATDSGRPYFVMELVAGEAITAFCDRQKQSVDERLELFAQVCHAIQHAHQKGIIHRDIKPSNVLVTIQDGRPWAKVIDFGIAKATAQRLTERTFFTEHSQLIGTPEYMSPEQAEGSVDIDTRTDVYSLGVLLYEILTGATPFEPARLRGAAWAEMLRIIREDEPPRPSNRLSRATDTLPAIAARRRVEPARLNARVRGELDWIVMKAIEKARARRYESPNALAADVLRHLAGEAIEAAPPSRLYSLRKLVRRHRGLVAGVTLVAATLVVGTIGTTWGMLRARAAEREQSQLRFKAEQVAKFMRQTFEGITPEVADGRDTALLKDLIDRAAKRLEAMELRESQAVSIDLRLTIGSVYTVLASYDDAERILTPAYEQVRTNAGADPETHIRALICLAALAVERGQLPRAAELYQSALDRVEALSVVPPDGIGQILGGLGNIARLEGRFDDAVALQRRSVEESRKQAGDDRSVAAALGNLATALKMNGEYVEAESLYGEILALLERDTQGDALAVATVLNNHSALLLSLGRVAEALPQLTRALAMYRRLFGDKHPQIAKSLINMGVAYFEAGRSAEAEPLVREALEIYRHTHPGDTEEVASALQSLAAISVQLRQPAAALTLVEEALAIHRRILAPGHPSIVLDLRTLAHCQVNLGMLAEAEITAREALAIDESRLRADHPQIASDLTLLGNILRDLGKPDESALLHRRALQIYRGAFPDEHATISDALAALGSVLLTIEKVAAAQEAATVMKECYERRRRQQSDSDWRVANSKAGWVGALVQVIELDPALTRADRLRRAREAEPLARESFDALTAAADKIPQHVRAKRLSDAAHHLARLYAAWDALEPDTGKSTLAAEWQRRTDELRAKK